MELTGKKDAGECLICKAPIEYLDVQIRMECMSCHKSFMSSARCTNGHYVCDECHETMGLYVIETVCRETESKNPVAIMDRIIQSPHIHMHGPEHHVLVGAALLAAYKNAGGEIDLNTALTELKNRGRGVPGGICGLWGACGAGISTGIFISLITKTTPLSGASWGLCNEMTSESLKMIGRIGGPRCCKRDSYTAILQAVNFVKEHFGVVMERQERVMCRSFPENSQCLGKECPYYPEK